jgi:hypothetical protein
MKNKKAAMEMSVGTIVTIVLLMSVLILGIFLIQKIFGTAKGAIDMTEEQLYNQINELFSSDEGQRIMVYPQTRALTIKKKKSDAFGWGLYNDHPDDESFSSQVSVAEIGTGCTMTETQAENLISLGKSQSNILVASASRLTHPKKIIFNIPDTAKVCQITYALDVTDKEGAIYDSVDLLLTIK